MSLPLLSILVALPGAGAALIWFLPARFAGRAAATAMAAALLAAVAAVLAFDTGSAGFQFQEEAAWIASLNIHYRVGVDGLSLLFLPATTLLFLAGLAAVWRQERASRLHFSLLLLLESATLGVFCALDTVLFFFFWELALVPVYGLLGGWPASPEGRGVAARYCLIMLAGGVPLLFAILFLAASQPATPFDLAALLAAPLPRDSQYVLFFLFLLGFGLKAPLVPLHTWLPQFALAAPGGMTALLVGLKLGAYGLIRFAVPLAPVAARELHWLLAGAGTLAVLYGAVGMLAQTNLRVMLAYSSISHVGLAVLGLAALDAQGAQGAVAMVLNFSVAGGGAFLLLEFLRQRTGSTDVASLGGVARAMPLLAGGFLLCGLTGAGLPGTSGFPGELMVLLAALRTHTGAGLGALFGLVVGAAGFLSLYRKAFFGPVSGVEVGPGADLRPRERVVVLAIIVIVIGFGVWPAAVLDVIAPAAQAWAARLP